MVAHRPAEGRKCARVAPAYWLRRTYVCALRGQRCMELPAILYLTTAPRSASSVSDPLTLPPALIPRPLMIACHLAPLPE